MDPSNQNNLSDLYNLISNPDRFDDHDSDNMLQLPCSEYFSVSDINNAISSEDHPKSSLFLLHVNIRSLSKNLDLLYEHILTLSKFPDIIAITESKLNDKSISNVSIPNYDLFHDDSPTRAGGTAIYVRKSLNAVQRSDIKLNVYGVESSWIVIKTKKLASIVIGCIYRHPGGNFEEFSNKLEELLKQFNNKKQEVYILGDFNIDFLKYEDHNLTENYINMLLAEKNSLDFAHFCSTCLVSGTDCPWELQNYEQMFLLV